MFQDRRGETYMKAFSRTDISLLSQWWWTVDRWTVAAIMALMTAGIFLIMAASPPVANRLEFHTFHFVNRQLLFLPLAMITMFAVSFFSTNNIRRLSLVIFSLAAVLMIFALVSGTEIKGATRWVNLAGISVQPSEFIKPFFLILRRCSTPNLCCSSIISAMSLAVSSVSPKTFRISLA